MIDTVEDRLKRRTHIREVHHPAGTRIDWTRNVQLDAKGVTVQPRALVPGRHIGQAMSGFDSESAEDLHRCIGAGRKKEGKLSGAALRRLENANRAAANAALLSFPAFFLPAPYAALRRRELEAQLQVPQVQRMELQSLHTVKSTEPK
jgi:hypothetical protein